MLLKKIALFHILPLIIGALIVSAFVHWRPIKNPLPTIAPSKISKINYIDVLPYADLDKQLAFSLALKQKIPVLLGSSELTSNHLAGLAQNFFSQNPTKDKFLSLGHAGFQCFGILTTLAANRALLKGSKISIVLSPGWFERQYASGTSLRTFFEFCPPNYLYQIYKDSALNLDTKNYIADYVSRNYDKISKPDAVLRLMGKKQTFVFSNWVNLPFLLLDEIDLRNQEQSNFVLLSQHKLINTITNAKVPPYRFYTRMVNWDSLSTLSKKEFKKLSNNNTLAVENNYYNTWLKNKPKKIMNAVQIEKNQEFKDFEALIHFLKKNQCEPLFIVMPLNAKAHEDLKVLQPTIDAVKNLLDKENLKVLDLFSPNVSQKNYEDGILEDIMHPYNTGWYKIDKFILDNYHD